MRSYAVLLSILGILALAVGIILTRRKMAQYSRQSQPSGISKDEYLAKEAHKEAEAHEVLADSLEARLREACARLGLHVLGYWPSAIAGGDGNKEFWIGARCDEQQSEY